MLCRGTPPEPFFVCCLGSRQRYKESAWQVLNQRRGAGSRHCGRVVAPPRPSASQEIREKRKEERPQEEAREEAVVGTAGGEREKGRRNPAEGRRLGEAVAGAGRVVGGRLLTGADGGHGAGRERPHPGGGQASPPSAACSIALGSRRHPPLHCLNCSLTQHSHQAGAGRERCLAQLSSQDQACPCGPEAASLGPSWA